jgi:tetratricopeptide (TPR) repeat protein
MLSISVAVYNLPEITRRCFESLERSLDGVPFEVLVVDNHSTDPAMQPFYASLDAARYKLFRSGANIGYRGAHRENARRFSGDWFIIINNDLVFEELRWDRKLQLAEGIAALGVKGDVCNAIAEDGAGYYDPRAVRTPMYIDGHFMAIPRQMLLDQGLFEDEQIQFCYFEDADHCFTLRQKGYGFGFIPLGLTHFRSSTVRSLAADERLFLLQTFERNRTRFLSKWADEIRRLRAGLSWDDVELEGCPKRPSAQTPVSSAAASLIQRGLEDHKAGKFAEAEALYRQAMSKSGGRPVPAADNLMAALMMDTARADQALTYARRAVTNEPGTAFYRTMLGNAEQAAGRLPDAFRSYLCALRLNSRDEYALYNLARLCLLCRMWDQAAGFYRMALDISPAMSEASYGLGRSMVELGRFDEAAKLLRSVLDAFPAHEDAAIELSRLHIDQRRYDEAETVLRVALKHLKDSHALHNNLGVALYKRGDPRGARAEFRAALSRVPDNPEYLTNAGLSMAAEEDLMGAVAAYRRAIELVPDYADAHWNLSLALLLGGQYIEGWREYRWGLRTKKPRTVVRHFDRPAWEGSSLSNKRILLYTEQGYGDAFQFVRYANLFRERGGSLILQCQRGLGRLMRGVAGVETVIQEGEALPEFDMHASIFDAPRVFGTTIDDIPSVSGYIRAEDRLRKNGK